MIKSRIRDLRLKRNLNLEQAVGELGISKSMLYKLETGERSPSKALLLKMSEVYKCSLDDLFTAIRINDD